MVELKCDACGRVGGQHESYESWGDAARAMDWEVGEDWVLCNECLGRPNRTYPVTTTFPRGRTER